MVPTQQMHPLWVFHLESEQQADRLYALSSPVHVIPQEQVGRLWREASVFHQSQHVVELAVGITAHLHWRTHLQQHRLLQKYASNYPNQG